MYQSSKLRKYADEKHICSSCIKEKYCDIKPKDWRYVLTFCKHHEKEGD